MSNKVVIYIGGFELPDKNAAAHRVLNNAKILRELGYQVVFIGVTKSADSICKDNFDGFDSIAVPYPNGTKKWLKHLCDTSIFEEVAAQYGEIAGVIFYNYQSVAMSRIMRWCKKRNIWTVADSTEWYLADKKNPVFYIIKQADTSIRMRWLQKKVSGVIAISSYLADYYKDKVEVFMLPPLVDKQEAKWQIEVKSHSEKLRIRLIYAGTIGALKDNLKPILVNLVEFKDKLELCVVGTDREDMLKYLSVQEQENLLDEHIIFMGRRSHKECLKLVSESDFQIFLRENNLVTRAGFPTKLGESFTCGTPVITNLSSNIGDYLKDGQNGVVVKSLEEASIKEALRRVATMNRDDINHMKSFCKNMKEFDYRYYIDDMKAFIEKISKNN